MKEYWGDRLVHQSSPDHQQKALLKGYFGLETTLQVFGDVSRFRW